MQDATIFWDRIADKYARTPIKDQESYAYTLGRTRSYLHADDTVLELGCGTGSTALKLAPSVGHITATDIAAGMIAKGQEKAEARATENVAFAVGDAFSAPRGPFDVVMAFNLLHLVENLDATLAAIHDRVAPGGLFISKTFCVPTGFNAQYLLMRPLVPLLQLIGKAPFVAFFSPAELDAAIERAGFDIVEVGQGPTKDARRYLVARKR